MKTLAWRCDHHTIDENPTSNLSLWLSSQELGFYPGKTGMVVQVYLRRQWNCLSSVVIILDWITFKAPHRHLIGFLLWKWKPRSGCFSHKSSVLRSNWNWNKTKTNKNRVPRENPEKWSWVNVARVRNHIRRHKLLLFLSLRGESLPRVLEISLPATKKSVWFNACARKITRWL